MNKIAPAGLRRLDPGRYQVSKEETRYEGLILRSADLHGFDFPDELLAIARAGSGTNNSPIDQCNARGIAVFNTPGANANAVKELLIADLLLASRDLLGGIQWVRQQVADGVDVTKVVEKGKAAFVGPELVGKTLGIIGLGAIGAKVANAAINLGMHVLGYDPYLSVDHALSLNTRIEHVTDLDDIFRQSDYITLHLHFNKSTANIIDQDAVSKMKGGVRIINLARGGLVSDDAIIEGLESGRVAKYITDFPDNRMVQTKNVVAMPHLGASTPESETNCAIMAADELRDYLENGNITNSVNLPNLTMRRSGDCRICVIHKNVPNMISQIAAVMGQANVNIEHMVNRSRGDIAYTVVDSLDDVPADIAQALSAIEGVVRARSIC